MARAIDSDAQGSPYHPGERAVQQRAGARDFAEHVGRKVIRDAMPDQHRDFFAALPMIAVGSVDAAGRPWASLLFGRPGFVASPDPRLLRIAAVPIAGDPLHANLALHVPIGLVGIQPETRRRNRMNGFVSALDRGAFTVTVKQSFGNCPKYIQARTPSFTRDPSANPGVVNVRQTGPILGEDAIALIRRSDTFFIASASVDAHSDRRVEGVDVNHRGGRPGFVRVDHAPERTVLLAPDFVGNSLFSTLGNIAANPRAGLLFVDFASGDLLSMTAEAVIVWDAPELRTFEGAERLLRFSVAQSVYLERAVPLQWTEPVEAPQLATTGSW